MSDAAEKTVSEDPNASAIYDADGAVREDLLETIRHAIEVDDAQAIVGLTRDWHESETADLIEALSDQQRQDFVRLSGAEFDFTVLTEVDEAIRVHIVDSLPTNQVVDGVRDLDSDDAVFILEDLGDEDREEILAQIPFQERIRLRRSLDYPEESAGRRMQTEFIAVPPFWTVGQAIDYIRETHDLPDRFSEIFTIEPTFKLAGTLPLDKLIKTKRDVRVDDIHDTNAHPVPAAMDQEEAAQIFEQYDLLSAPVLDENDRLVGVLTIDDVVDVIQAEADEDIRRLAGVGDEELSDSVRNIARSRVGWLMVNLLTAVLASLIIGMFDATIEQMVALAVLMPIVASMGGNAGTQTMTVAVRALATKDLDTNNARRIIRKEMLVGLFNGLLFAVIIGIVAAVWFGLPSLGFVIGIAMVVNMLFAAGSGILIPVALDKWGADPAIASGVFVTTVTDVVGFFAFLGLAAWWYGI